jgi:excisionase family DNA binding protein
MSKRHRFLTKPEAADELRLSQRQIDRLIAAKHLTKIKLGAKSLIVRDSLEEYIRDRQYPDRPHYSSLLHVRIYYLPREDPQLAQAAGRAIDEHLTKTLPGCWVTVNGARVCVYVPSSTGHAIETVERELLKLWGDA